MADGSTIGGYFGGESFASAHPHSGDLYLQELWNVSDDGAFVERVANSKGALFRKGDYVWLEFYRDSPTGEENDNGAA